MGLVNCLLSQGQFEEPVRPFALSMNEDCVELCRYFPPLQNYWIRGCLHSLHPPKKNKLGFARIAEVGPRETEGTKDLERQGEQFFRMF